MSSSHDIPDAESVLAHLLSRHSVGPKHLVAPGPGLDELSLAARAALRAPDHQRLAPFRLIVIPDERREELARLFEGFARRSGKSGDEALEEAQRARNGPVLVALAARIVSDHPLVPVHEQWISVGAALANFMNALHCMGYAAKMLSGRKAADPQIRASLCPAGETLVGWIVIGTPRIRPHARDDDDPARVLWHWR